MPTAAFWEGRRVLVTGHTGFKGAWLVALLHSMGAEVSGLALAPTARSAYDAIGGDQLVCSTLGDIRDRAVLRRVLDRHRPEVILHLAAQALVRQSYADPVETFDVNVVGTAALLHEARATPSVRVALVVTSDKVYANDGRGRPFVESDPLGGGDPYSASKAAAEMVVGSWQHRPTEGQIVVAARAGNVIGGGDRAADRLLPDVYRAVESGASIQVRNPDAVRPWQFVIEPIVGYLAYVEAAWDDPDAAPPALNFGPGPDACWPVRRVVDAVTADLGVDGWQVAADAAGDQPEAAVLQLDSTLAATSIGWRPRLDLPTALAWTTAWHRAEQSGEPLHALMASQLARYGELAGA
jgi:CDP-glucose 4,6-dehydratase